MDGMDDDLAEIETTEAEALAMIARGYPARLRPAARKRPLDPSRSAAPLVDEAVAKHKPAKPIS